MPIARLGADEANRNLRGNRASLWPDGRVPTDRLGKVARLSFDASFTFSKSDRILTIGSCFARNMEQRLAQLGFDLPMKQVFLPPEERSTKTENDILIKFTVQSMKNELEWASGVKPPPPEKLFLQVGEGLWHDPQLVNNVHSASLERLIERREMVQSAFRQAPDCKVVIITLGLAEAWFDHETSLYLNTAPPTAAIKRDPGRFSLDVLSYGEILEALERIHEILRSFGRPDFKMLITVSPVPFKATFTGQDAITANSYSKAVQRAACGEFVARHDNVDYFPSYEIVTMSDREQVYERDNLHVGGSAVAYIVDQVLTHYTTDLEFTHAKVGTPKSRRQNARTTHYDLFALAKHQFETGETDKALESCQTVFRDHYEGMSDRDRSFAHTTYSYMLAKLRRWADAAVELEQAVKLAPQVSDGWRRLGEVYIRLGRRKDAVQALERAVEIDPGDAESRQNLAAARAPFGLPRLGGLKRLFSPAPLRAER
jgi:tetratricopeptide (TPR) repeat protein